MVHSSRMKQRQVAFARTRDANLRAQGFWESQNSATTTDLSGESVERVESTGWSFVANRTIHYLRLRVPCETRLGAERLSLSPSALGRTLALLFRPTLLLRFGNPSARFCAHAARSSAMTRCYAPACSAPEYRNGPINSQTLCLKRVDDPFYVQACLSLRKFGKHRV